MPASTRMGFYSELSLPSAVEIIADIRGGS
jgi:hypothetical protein